MDKWELSAYIPNMASAVLDSAGRIVIPKVMRNELGLAPGDPVSIELEEERVTIRPERPDSAMRREHGLWVFRSGERISSKEIEEAIEQGRRERSRALRGR
jgi:AbrB family looped-hinge helix DNA binding protein